MTHGEALDFVLVGPFKTGTSWMDTVLRTHPAVSLPGEVKETFYFSNDAYFERGPAWFDALFEPARPGGKRGEVAPSYFHSLEAPERLHAVAPNCTIVCSFREPAARLQSFHRHLIQRGEVAPDSRLLDVLEQRPFLWETARYGHHLERWISHFGAERVKVLFYEDLRADRVMLARSLFAAVDLDPVPLGPESGSAVNAAMTPVSPGLSRLFYGSARRLRRSGLHRVVNWAKHAGVGSLIVRPLKNRNPLADGERERIGDYLAADLQRFESLLDRPLPDAWR